MKILQIVELKDRQSIEDSAPTVESTITFTQCTFTGYTTDYYNYVANLIAVIGQIWTFLNLSNQLVH